MELLQYWQIIQRRWWVPAALTLLALVASTAVALRGASAFRTDLRLSVSTQPTLERAQSQYYDPVYYANLSSEYLADDLSEIIRSPSFAADVGTLLTEPVSPDVIAESTRTKRTHRLIDVTLVTATYEQGQQIGQAMLAILNDPTKRGGYLKVLDAYTGQVAVVNVPITRRGNGNAAVAAEIGLRTLVGLLVGLGLALLVDYLDQRVRTRREVEELLGLPILGEIPTRRRAALA